MEKEVLLYSRVEGKASKEIVLYRSMYRGKQLSESCLEFGECERCGLLQKGDRGRSGRFVGRESSGDVGAQEGCPHDREHWAECEEKPPKDRRALERCRGVVGRVDCLGEEATVCLATAG